MILNSTPKKDGYYMPAEYAMHQGTVLIWPVRPGSWPFEGKEAKKTFTEIANVISASEKVYLLAYSEFVDEARDVFAGNSNVEVFDIKTDDAWARDVGPTCVINDWGEVRCVNWSFNAWGGEFDGLYAHYENDDAAACAIADKLGLNVYEAAPFVLEGGSIHSDGEGTILVTESCLLSPGRNPSMSKEEIEVKLCDFLGADKVIWLPRGIYNDETNEHVDNVCAFVGPAEVVLAWTDDESDPQYEMSMQCQKVLEGSLDARGREFKVHKLYIPKKPVCVEERDLLGYVFDEGEDERELGERLAASYVNFYIANGAVLVPQFGDENDVKAVELLGGLFKDREVVPIAARSIIVGGGNIHCITQQIPLGK